MSSPWQPLEYDYDGKGNIALPPAAPFGSLEVTATRPLADSNGVACTCGAPSDGKWGGIHTAHCPSLLPSPEVVPDGVTAKTVYVARDRGYLTWDPAPRINDAGIAASAAAEKR